MWPFSLEVFFQTDQFYNVRSIIGIDAYDRTTVWNYLGEAREHLHMLGRDYMSGDMRVLSIECQFLLTLTILRRNYGTVLVFTL